MSLNPSISSVSRASYDSWDEDSDFVMEFDSDDEDTYITEASRMTFSENPPSSGPAVTESTRGTSSDHGDENDEMDDEMDDSDYDSDYHDDEKDDFISPGFDTQADNNASDINRLRVMAAMATRGYSAQQSAPINSYQNPIHLSIRPPTKQLSDSEIETAALRMLSLRYTKHETHASRFNILLALVARPELMELVACWLDPDSLCHLYSVSRPFHHLMNTRYHYYIKGSARIWAPFGRKIYPFHAFRNLCIEDPASRPIPHGPSRTRHVPSIKYLKMIVSRQSTVDEILALLDQAGHKLPRDTHITLQKIWLTMSIPGNGARIGLLHNRTYWTDQDLYLATHFFLKLDMHCTDPVDGSGEHTLRDTFLGKNSLVPLHKLLHGRYTPLQIIQHFVVHDYRVPAHQAHLSVFGIPAHLVGRGCIEGWGAGTERALGVCEGVMLEAMRRDLKMNRYYLDMMLYGYSEITDNVPYGLDSKEPRHFEQNEEQVDWHLRQYGVQSV
jgi:hypothetical protein